MPTERVLADRLSVLRTIFVCLLPFFRERARESSHSFDDGLSPPQSTFYQLFFSFFFFFFSNSLSSRLATGASVSKSPSNPNQEEIVIQGDVTEIVKDLILKRIKPFDTLPADISEKNVVIEEEKKKKKEEGEGGAEGGGD